MVAFEGLIDEVVYLTFLVEIFLRCVGGKDIIEIEVFGGVAVVDLYFFALEVLANAGVCVPVFELVFEEGSDPNCSLNLATH